MMPRVGMLTAAGCLAALWSLSAAAAERQDYLFDALKNPTFASAYQQLTHAARLPDWVRLGGTSSPAQPVAADPQQGRIFASCKPHDCPAQQILIYQRSGDGHLSGVFVRTHSRDGVNPDQTNLQWLGHPESNERHWLLTALDPE